MPLGCWWERHAATTVLDPGQYQAAFTEGKLDRRALFRRFTAEGVIWEDGSHEALETVIFATGYRPNLDYLVDRGAIDAQGRARHRGGVSLTTPGLYYLGLSWQRTYASATLRGVGPDALAIMKHLRRGPPLLETHGKCRLCVVRPFGWNFVSSHSERKPCVIGCLLARQPRDQ